MLGISSRSENFPISSSDATDSWKGKALKLQVHVMTNAKTEIVGISVFLPAFPPKERF